MSPYRVFSIPVVVVVNSHIQRINLATEETTMIQQVSHRPIKCQSRSWPQRCTTVKGSHHGDSPLLKPTGIQIATKPMPGTTKREHRRFIDVKKVSLFGYELQFLLSGQKFELQAYREDCLMCCPTNKSSKVIQNISIALDTLHEDKVCDILQAMTPTNVEMVHQTSLFHVESNSDRLGLLSPTQGQRSQQQRGKNMLRLVLINKPRFL